MDNNGTTSLQKKSSRTDREALRRRFYEQVDSNQMTLAEAIRGFRKMLGKNQREFAKYVGIPPRTIMAVEQGKGNPTLKTVAKLLRGTGLEIKVGRKRRRTSP